MHLLVSLQPNKSHNLNVIAVISVGVNLIDVELYAGGSDSRASTTSFAAGRGYSRKHSRLDAGRGDPVGGRSRRRGQDRCRTDSARGPLVDRVRRGAVSFRDRQQTQFRLVEQRRQCAGRRDDILDRL
jgi:hypothetical protein